MRAFLLGGEPGTNPVTGGFDSAGGFHTAIDNSSSTTGQIDVIASDIDVEVHLAPTVRELREQAVAQPTGHIALAS